MKKMLLILIACFSLNIGNACCSEPELTFTEILLQPPVESKIFICKVDSSWVSQRSDFFSFATVQEILVGENIQKKIKLSTGGNNSAGGNKLEPGKEYLIISGSQDGYQFYAFQCDPFSAALDSRLGYRNGLEKLRLIRKVLKLKRKKYTGKVKLQIKNHENIKETLAEGFLKNGKLDGLWKHNRYMYGKLYYTKEITYKKGVLNGLYKKYKTNKAGKKIISAEMFYTNGEKQFLNIYRVKNDSSMLRIAQVFSKNGKGDIRQTSTSYYDNGHVSERSTIISTSLKNIGYDFFVERTYDGFFESFYENGLIKETGEYRLGAKVGIWQYYDFDDQLEQKFYEPIDTVFEGFRTYNPNGSIKYEGAVKNNKAHGLWKRYHENGELSISCEFVDGKPNGRKAHFNSNGSKSAHKDYKNGKLDGTITYYHHEGKISSFTTYKNGKKEGDEKRFHKDGSVAFKGFYKDDNAEGKFIYLNEKGEVYTTENYKNGYLHGPYKRLDNKTGELKEKGTYENGLKIGKWVEGKNRQWFKRECFFGPLSPERGDSLGNQHALKCIEYDERGNVIREHGG